MTKQEEINLITKFANNLNDGYLQDIFKDILPMIVNAINTDITYIPFWNLVNQQTELQKEILAKKKMISDLENDLKHKQRTKDTLEKQIESVKRDISRLADAI